MDKRVVFISHINEEAEIANSLKTVLESSFLNIFDVFVSSNPDSIQLGDKWFDRMADSISNAALIIVICSPLSEKRPWINFEAGCGFAHNIPVVPLCHSGLKPADLSFPLSAFQGAELNSQSKIQVLFDRIARIINISPPKMDDHLFFEQLTAFENSIKDGISISNTKKIDAILAYNIQYLKYIIKASITDFTESSNENTGFEITDFDSIVIAFNKIYCLLNPSLLMPTVTQKNYELLYQYIKKLTEDIKFILTCNKFTQIEQLEDLFDDFIISSNDHIEWYQNICLIDHNKSSIKDGIINEIKKQEATPDYRPSNIINSFIDYYKSIIYLHKWIVEYEAVIRNIIVDM